MASIAIYKGYQKVLDSFPDYQFKKAIELFSGKGNITRFLAPRIKYLTCVDANLSCGDNIKDLPNIGFVPMDSLELVTKFYTTQRYDIVDVDCDTGWTGLGGHRIEFYCLFPEVIRMCKKLLALTFIQKPEGKFYRDYLQNCQQTKLSDKQTDVIIEGIMKERNKFWKSENLSNWHIMSIINKEANKVGKTAELILNDKYCDTHSRLYFSINDIEVS